MSSNGSMNSYHNDVLLNFIKGLDKSERIINEINVHDYNYYKVNDYKVNEADEFKHVNINDYVHPSIKRQIDKGLDDFFNKRHKGEQCIKSTAVNDKSLKSSNVNNMLDKSVQTNSLNICPHYKFHNETINYPVNGCKEIKTLNRIVKNNRNGNNMLSQMISAAKKITLNGVEETRKKLHITRISSDAPSFLNKGNVCANRHTYNELRYINFKCKSKLQHIPLKEALHKNNVTLHQNNSSSSTYILNRSTNNYNFISKTQSPFSQTQELKTYSRKSENGCLSNTSTDHKYLTHHESDKFYKLQNNIVGDIQKINNNYYKPHSKIKSIMPVASTTAVSTNGDHIKLSANYNSKLNNSFKDNNAFLKGQGDSLYSSNHNNCSTHVNYNSSLL